MSKSRNCEYCNKEFYTESKYTGEKIQKFCQVKCRSNYNSYKNRYGLTLPMMREMIKAQDYKCKICNKDIHLDSTSRVNTARVDHDHSTGEVRGLLCNGCNTGLGLFNENIEALKKAIEYLESSKKEKE